METPSCFTYKVLHTPICTRIHTHTLTSDYYTLSFSNQTELKSEPVIENKINLKSMARAINRSEVISLYL